MKINLCPTAREVKNFSLEGKTAIAIDVLRATSCIVTALANQCSKVIPVYTPEDALELKEKLGQGILLGGERKSIKIPGFDLANSPLEYVGLNFEKKKLVITTTNGTRAIKEASSAKTLLIGSILNAKATAKKTIDLGNPLALICAGTKDKFSLDDFLTTGLIISEIEKLGVSLELTDLAFTAKYMYESLSTSILDGLKLSYHGQELIKMGLEKDLVFCSQENKYPIVAEYKDGEISVIS